MIILFIIAMASRQMLSTHSRKVYVQARHRWYIRLMEKLGAYASRGPISFFFFFLKVCKGAQCYILPRRENVKKYVPKERETFLFMLYVSSL